MWGEGINAANADAYIWRGAAAAAERLWSPLALTPSHAQATGRFTEHLCRLQGLGVRAGPIGPGFCPSDVAQGAEGAGVAEVRAAALAAAGAGQGLVLSREQARALAAAL